MSWHRELQEGVETLSHRDPIIASLIAEYPQPTFEPHVDYYRELIDSIIGQQLSVKAAATIRGRFFDSFGHVPTPEELLACDDEMLRGVGLSYQKSRYLKDLAHKVLSGELRFDHLSTLNNDQIVAELTAVKGVGEWTAHMFLMFCMGRLNVLPTGDLGIKNAIMAAYNLPTAPTPDEMQLVATQNNWPPYQSIASWYLWQSLNNKPINTNVAV